MADGQDIINDATTHLKVRRANTAFNTQDSDKNADVFTALQNLISALAEEQYLNIPAPTATTDTLDIPDGDIRGLGYLLAVEVADQFGKEVSRRVDEKAQEGKDKLGSQSTLDLEADFSGLAFTHLYNIREDR